MNRLIHGLQAAGELAVVARSLCNIAIHTPVIIRVTECWISQDHRDGPGTKMMPVVHPSERYLAQVFAGLWMCVAVDPVAGGQLCRWRAFYCTGLIFRI